MNVTGLILTRLSVYPRFFSNTYFISYNNCRFKSTILNNMGKPEEDVVGMSLKEIIEKLNSFAPITTAEGWDNVGLLMDPMATENIKKILLTNDLTEEVVNEAKGNRIGLIISYHPPIFRALKHINSKTWKERIVIQCIKNNIAVYSPHTSWDVVQGGVNDWLAKAFDTITCKPITETGCGRKLELSAPIKISEAIHKIKKHIGLPHVQLGIGSSKTIDSEISTVALCAGSGASVLSGIKADLYLTGEMSHHEVLDAVQTGTSVVLCNHSNSERGFLNEFAPKLEETLLEKKVKVMVSLKDKDPLVVV